MNRPFCIKAVIALAVLVLLYPGRAEPLKVFFSMHSCTAVNEDRAAMICRAIRADLMEMGIAETLTTDAQAVLSPAKNEEHDTWLDPELVASLARDLGYDWVVTGKISSLVNSYSLELSVINAKYAVPVFTTKKVYQGSLDRLAGFDAHEVSLALAGALENGLVTAKKRARSNIIRNVSGGVGLATVAVAAVAMSSFLNRSSSKENTRDAVLQW